MMNKLERYIIFSLIFALILPATISFGQSYVEARVTVAELNVRAQPGTGAAVLGLFRLDWRVQVQGRENQAGDEGIWVYTSHEDLTGWVLSAYLEFPEGFDIYSLPITGDAGSALEQSASAIEGALPGITVSAVNFRTGPGTNNNIIRTLPAETPVAFVGRNSNNTWFKAVVGGREGWLFHTLVTVQGEMTSLPVLAEAATVSSNTSSAGSAVPGIVSNVGPRARQIFLAGQQMGNRANVFSKVGDSITWTRYFLFPVGVGGLQLHGYTYLQPVVDYFSSTPARSHNSFANDSAAAGGGWTSATLLTPGAGIPGVCYANETPLACEYRVSRPAVALIMIGTNDAAYLSGAVFQQNLSTVVQISIDMGVIPVLSTIPDNLTSSAMSNQALYFNSIIRNVALSYGVPLWDYWAAMQDLPNKGLSGDGVHPSINVATGETGIFSPADLRFGYNMRNLTALMVLDTIWRQVLY